MSTLYIYLSEAKASHSHRTWTEVSSSVPHFLQVGLLHSPIIYRCLLKLLCPVSRPITTLDCVLLKDSNRALLARSGPEINSRACLCVLQGFSRWRHTTQGRARRSGAYIRRSPSLCIKRLIIFSTRLIQTLSRYYRVAMFTVGVYRHCVLCEVCPHAEGTVKHRECNTTSTTDCSTVIRKINSWFTLKIKKRPLKEAVEQRVNIVTVCYVTSRG